MLVLTRKKNEKIRINDDITIVVIKNGKGGVRLGIDAPKETKILREELYLEPREETSSLA